MNYLTLLIVIASTSISALPRPDETPADDIVPLLESTNVRDDSGQFALSYLTANGISVVEQGSLKSLDGKSHVLVKQGAYAYLSPNGQIFKVTYIADENGFQPIVDPLPIAPEVPIV